ncbi:hypothetical protein C2857_000875 [Epichloe festucae Fl1]|uniref:F-box domain-containing protein n=1 Tax=Epichloe festucae (strain Fl1) TaxID=877507 RepID=A0A7U3SNH8_EPIFF|nr:hypothetical protein C2857_000875 [Epichloe festucae Fl1]
MQREPSESSEQPHQDDHPSASPSASQYGLLHHEFSGIRRVRSADLSSGSRSGPPGSVSDQPGDSLDAVDADQLDENLRGLSLRGKTSAARRWPVAGQRVSEHENALTPPTPRHALGFKVIRRSDSSNGAQLTDFPNEILTHILSHLHPDSHAAVALVSKRFYALVTTPHAWRMAFMRYFPGHTCLDPRSAKNKADLWAGSTSDIVRSDIRYFGRLTVLATWRSEYLFRTRLMRSLTRGKPGSSPGGTGSSGGTGKSAKRKNAVLTYNSKLPWLVTNIHSVFSSGKKPPRAIQGAGDLGVATMSDPTTGKIEKWGLEDSFSCAQLEEVVPNLVPFGLGDGPAAVPNIMDVSQPHGIIAGEGFPGGRAYFRAINEACGRYLGGDTGVVDTYPDVPKIPEMSDSICSVWIAKSSAVPASTKSMCGMLTGSALGVVTAYALGWDPDGPRFANGDMTARWVVSPGVPIISLKVDDNYGMKRKSSSRVWAVALNALGEVFYLTETPVATLDRSNGNDIIRHAWLAGRTAYWHLVESTRRAARPDELDKNVIRGAYTPRSPSNAMRLSKEQLAAEAREIEKFLLYRPSHFRQVCEGWDMRRRMEVDFAADDGQGAGESIFVIDCGLFDGAPGRVRRFSRLLATSLPSQGSQQRPSSQKIASATSTLAKPHSSLFGSAGVVEESECHTPQPHLPDSPAPTPMPPRAVSHGMPSLHDWDLVAFELKGLPPTAQITASCLDCSSPSLLTLGEDPLHTVNGTVEGPATAASRAPSTPLVGSKSDHVAPEIPGRRARLLAMGTNTGAVIVWDARDRPRQGSAQPVRILQTDSPEISCLATSALYLVHGGSDGLVQAWDPLASTLGPIRTLNARSNGRVPRHMMAMNPTLRDGNYTAVGAIFLDPDPTVLRGVLSCGSFLRYWTYSSSGHPAGKKRRTRHSDIHGRIASRRLGGTVSGHIAAEEAELRRENEARAREQAHLRKRFGVGALGDLTEEEALRYAQMISEEAYLEDEQRRASDSAVDAAGLDTASSLSDTAADTMTPEPSVMDMRPPPMVRPSANSSTTDNDEESEFELQVQQAIRLSLLEGVNDMGQSPRGNGSGDFEFPFTIKAMNRKGKVSGSASSSPGSTHQAPFMMPNGDGGSQNFPATADDEDFALALSISMQAQETGVQSSAVGLGVQRDDFPPLETEGPGKGKGVRRW